MINTLHIYNELKQTMDSAAAEKIADVIGAIYKELLNTVTKTEFNELKETVSELAQAQKRTEEQVKELVQAQKRTEEQVKELAQAQRDLAEAQRDLTEGQRDLAEAQERTEKALAKLSKQVGGLSDVVGGDIEDIAYTVLHSVLQREFGWQVGVLKRTWLKWGDQPEKVNIFGKANDPKRPETTIWVVGEAKHNLSVKEVKKFIKQLDRARRHLIGEIFPVCFCYRARPEVQQMVLEAGVRLVFSYGELL